MDIDIDESIKKWEKDVIDTSKNNRLLYFNPESFLKITTPSMLFLFDDLVNKDKKMKIHLSGAEENRKKDELIFSKNEDISKSLGNLFYQANASLKEHGSNVLYISFGVLKWSDENGKEVETQLFFVPVTLNRKMYNNYSIESMEGDIFFNPVLREKLEQLEFLNSHIVLDRIRELCDMLVKEGFAEVENEIMEQYKVLSSFSYLENFFMRVKTAGIDEDNLLNNDQKNDGNQ